MKKIVLSGLILILCLLSFQRVEGKIIQLDDEGYHYYEELDISQIETGWSSTIIIANGGRVYTFGENDYGQLGVGDTKDRSIPTDITPSLNLSYGEEVIHADISHYHAMIVTDENRVFTWGWGNYGGIGDGTKATRTSPVEITSYITLNTNEDIVDVSVGSGTAFLVTSDGRVFAWGWNAVYQLGDGTDVDKLYPTDITSTYSLEVGEYFVEIDSGEKFSIGLTNQNRIYSWGFNNYGQIGDGTYDTATSPVSLASQFILAPGEEFIAIKAGSSHSVVATSEQKVYAWGANFSSAIGDGTTVHKLSPVDISSYFGFNTNEQVIDIAGSSHTILLTNQNRRFGWGANNMKQLGDGSNTTRTTPTDITSHLPIYEGDLVELASGHNNGYLITSEGRMISWGDNDHGSLGDGNMGNDYDVWYPILISESVLQHKILPIFYGDISQIFSENERTFMIDTDNHVFAFGKNTSGELTLSPSGDVLGATDITDHFSLNVSEDINQIAIGGEHTLFLTSENRVFSVGDNTYNQLGFTGLDTHIPTDITSLLPLSVGDYVVEVTCGYYYSALRTNDGHMIVFGRNNFGQLGTGDTQNVLSPYNLNQDTFYSTMVITHLSAGDYHMLFSNSLEEVYATGHNVSGQLGIGNKINQSTPVLINDNVNFSLSGNVTTLDTGTYHSVILTSTNELYTFGENNFGQIGNNTNIDQISPLSINNQFPLAIGEVIIDVVAGGNHNLVKTSNNTVYVWGNGLDGVLGTGFTVPFKIPYNATSKYPSNISMFTASDTASFALTTSGDVYVTGKNDQGYLGLLHEEEVLQMVRFNKTAQELIDIWMFDRSKYAYDTSATIPVYLYPTYDIYELVDTVTINGVARTPDSSNGGLLVFEIPNTYSVGDVVTLEIEAITLKDTTVITAITGDTDVSFEVINDTSPPTFDVPSSLTFEISNYDSPDFRDYVSNLIDDYSEDIDLVMSVNNINENQIGVYNVQIEATDEAGNKSVSSISVTLEDAMPPDIMYIGGSDAEVLSNIDFMSFIRVYDLFEGNISENGNTMITPCDTSVIGVCEFSVYAEDSSGNGVTETFTLDLIDGTLPTFDAPEQATFEATHEDIDFTSLVTNVQDNYSQTVIVYTVHNDVVTNVPGSYFITVVAEDEYGNTRNQDINIIIVDTTPPTFDPIEDVTIELGESFSTEQIVSNISDNANTTTFISCDITYDSYVAQTYNATCTVTDADGNFSSDSFDIIVEDTVSPEFDFIEDQSISVSVEDVDWTNYVVNVVELSNEYTITETDMVEYGITGLHAVIVRVEDSSGNYTEQSFYVDVIDDSYPVLTLIGDAEMVLEVGEDFIDPGATCVDNGFPCTVTVIEDIDTLTTGTYQIIYEYVDTASNMTNITRLLYIQDTTPPVLDLEANIDTLYVGQVFVDQGLSIFDYSEYTVSVDTVVDHNTPGTYILTYTVTDTEGNSSSIQRVVTVLEEFAEIEFIFNGLTTIEVGQSYNLTCQAQINNTSGVCTLFEGSVDTNQAGVYELIYMVTYQNKNHYRSVFVFVYTKDIPLTLYYRKEDWEVII